VATWSGYIAAVRRLLHDATGNFYSDSDLTYYINEARRRVVRDTGCLRTLQSFTFPTGAETASFSSFPNGNQTIDVININVLWGNSRVPLAYAAWTAFNAQFRVWQSMTGRPAAFSVYGQDKVYIAPIPDQDYVAELDTVIAPSDLNSDNDVEQIADIYAAPVPFYAAYKAKYNEQQYGEAEIFKQEYLSQVQAVLNSVYTRRLPSAYSPGW